VRIIETSKDEFIESIKKKNLNIVIYGYGVIGSIIAPFFVRDNELVDNILFWVDADTNKQGTKINISGKNFHVVAPQVMDKTDIPFVILLTASRYNAIIADFRSNPVFEDKEVYILPHMLADGCKSFDKYELERAETGECIPKVIHYCWFGKNEIPEELKKYMESWKKYCPDYEIKRWDENNYNIEKYMYSSDAYKHGKFGFVPDIVRLDLLYSFGGIYLDTDVELIKPLDNLLFLNGFVGTEKWGIVNVGGGSGAVPGHPMIGEMLEYKKGIVFEREDGSLNLESSGTTESIPLIKRRFIPNNRVQNINGLTILTSDFFQPYDYMTKETYITENTYGIHHFYGSWCEK